MPYFDEPVGRVKIQTYKQTTYKQRVMSVWANFVDIYYARQKYAKRNGIGAGNPNLSNRSSGVQISRDICTRFGRYLYSTKCSWIIRASYFKDFSIIINFFYSPVNSMINLKNAAIHCFGALFSKYDQKTFCRD